MNQLTFIDKIQVLFKLLFSSPIIIGIFVFSMILMILLFFNSKLNKKVMKIIFISLYVLIIGFAVVRYGSYFLTSIDSFITLFMANIYFPVIPVYILIMLISFIIMIITLNSKSMHKVVKIINTVFFTLIQMLFALFVYIVESNKIDMSSNNNLYSNEQTLTLLELGMGLFFIWLLVLLIILYLKKADKIFKVKNNDNADDFDEYINDYNEPSGVVSKPQVINSEGKKDEIPDLNSNFVKFDTTPVSNDFSNGFGSGFGVFDFNNIQNSSNLQDRPNEEIVNFNIFSQNSNNMNNSNSMSNSSVDTSKADLERKNEDVEIIDFDF